MRSSLELLHRFHHRHPGASALVFGPADAGAGRSSYDLLADAVPADAADVLDLACGDGALLERLVRRGRALTGLDANSSELAAARERLGDGARLVEGLAQHLTFTDRSFDAVVSHMALMLMDEPERVLAEVRRVLRPGGTLAFVVGRHSPPPPAEAAVWSWLRARWREEGLEMRLGDGRWSTTDTVRALVEPVFGRLELEELDAHVAVPVDGLFTFLERAYYPIDALSEDGKRAFASFLADRATELAPAGAVAWRFEMTLGRCRSPGGLQAVVAVPG